MKLERKQKSTLDERLEKFKRKRTNEELELDNKITIEMPVLNAQALVDMKERKKHNDELLEPKQKEVDELVDETEKQKKDSEKKAQAFTEQYLIDNFKDKYLKEDNNYTVQCKGRKELRQLIEQCKLNNIKYKFVKLTEQDHKYDVKFTLVESVKTNLVKNNNYTKLIESLSQEIGQEYRRLSEINGIDFDELVYGKDGFMNALYPSNPNYVYFPDFNGDVIYSEKHWNELVDWAKKEKGLDIKGLYDGHKDDFFSQLGESLNEKLDLDTLKKLLKDYKDNKFELDSLYIDNDGWVATSDSSYSLEESLKLNERYGDPIKASELKNRLNVIVDKLNNVDDDAPIPSTSGTYGHSGEFIYLDNIGFVYFDEIDKLSKNNTNNYHLYTINDSGNMDEYIGTYENFDDAYKESQDYEYAMIERTLDSDDGEELDSKVVYTRNQDGEKFYDDELHAAYNESLDTTQKLIDDAKKFAKDNNKDVKVKGVVSSNECAIDTFPEDFNEMVKLFSSKFDVYDEDEELERFKIKEKSVVEEGWKELGYDHYGNQSLDLINDWLSDHKQAKEDFIAYVKTKVTNKEALKSILKDVFNVTEENLQPKGLGESLKLNEGIASDYDKAIDNLCNVINQIKKQSKSAKGLTQSKVDECIDNAEKGLKLIKDNLKYLVIFVQNNTNENLQQKGLGQTQINEDLQVVGDLKDYAPNDKALPLWTEILKNNLVDDFDLVLSDLYPDGVTIEQLNKLLSFDQDFVRSMIGLDSEPELDLRAEADKEFEDSLNDTIERDLDNDDEDNVDDIEDVLNDTEEDEENNKAITTKENPYTTTSTGYGEEEDLPDDDETYLG